MDGDILASRYIGPGFIAVTRDFVCTIVGATGAINQMLFRESPNLTILIFCMACLGVPGVSGGQILRRFFMDLQSPPYPPDSSSPSDSMNSSPE